MRPSCSWLGRCVGDGGVADAEPSAALKGNGSLSPSCLSFFGFLGASASTCIWWACSGSGWDGTGSGMQNNGGTGVGLGTVWNQRLKHAPFDHKVASVCAACLRCKASRPSLRLPHLPSRLPAWQGRTLVWEPIVEVIHNVADIGQHRCIIPRLTNSITVASITVAVCSLKVCSLKVCSLKS